MNHKEMTAHIRGRLKAAGIKAKCSMYDSCGSRWIRVTTPTYEARFDDDQQRTIRTIAQVNRLTWAQGLEINLGQMTDPQQMNFVFAGAQ